MQIFLDRCMANRPFVLVLSLALCAGVFLLDYEVVERYSFYLLYLLPILLSARYAGRQAAYAFVVLCTTAWFCARLSSLEVIVPSQLAWNTAVRAITFVFVAEVVRRLVRKQAMMAKLQRQLQVALGKEKKLSRHDFLTGAWNIRAFEERLALERIRSKRFGRSMTLVSVDLDNFKELNDAHGHPAGDRLLKKVAEAMQGVLRAVDTLARVGGDEFLILLPETDMRGARACVGRIMMALKGLMPPGMSASAGVLQCSNMPASNEAAMQAVDRVLYKAKAAGKDRAVYEGI